MLARVFHEILLWGTCPRSAKTRYNTKLAHLLPKPIYSPCIVDWRMLNIMGCGEEIENMLKIKVYEAGIQKEIFSSEAWRRVFDIKEPIYTEFAMSFTRPISLMRLIPKDPALGVPCVSIPKGLRQSMQDLYDRIGIMEIHQGVIEMMAYMKSYHWDSEDEEYVMAVRDFKKFFKRKGRFMRQPRNDKRTFQRSRDDKNGSWSNIDDEDDEKVKDETCLVAHASSEVCSESSYFSDENSSIDDLALDNEYDNYAK
nr:zf-CCHC domain-containing protein/DUF4219 domain-containing protein/UBN2 domain-containing protein [Tanacetum cinerariifolium]